MSSDHSPVDHSDLARRRLSYDCVGATRPADAVWDTPEGYRRYEQSERLGHGDVVWAEAAEALLRWEVKTRSGFVVLADQPAAGERFWITADLGPLTVSEPAVVVAVVQEPDLCAIAYGTLEGHPVSGEEAFLVRREADGTVWFTLRSLSRAPSGPWRLAYPLALVAQRFYRRRYLRALG